MNHERRNREFWDADADDYQAAHGETLAAHPMAWGVWRIPESDLHVLGNTAGLDVLEYGCGGAQWSVALAHVAFGAGGDDRGERHATALQGLEQMLAYFDELLEYRRAHPGEEQDG